MQSAACIAPVTDADIATYRANGWWVSPKLIDDEQLAALRKAHERIWCGERDYATFPYSNDTERFDLTSTRVRTLANGWWINEEVRRLVTSPLLGAVASRLMDCDEVRVWHDQVIYKPGVGPDRAGDEGNIGWHQDLAYWQACSAENMCTAWVALQDTDLNNGGMRSITGSHHWGLVPEATSFFDHDLEGLRERYGKHREWRDEPCVLKAGQISFHHALCFHGSGANRSLQPRLSVAIHLMPGGSSYTGKTWHSNVKGLGPFARIGDHFEGPWWPRIWPSQSSQEKS